MSAFRTGARPAWVALVALGAVISAMSGPAPAAETAPLVLTGLQATYSLALSLTAGTAIQVQNVPADGRQMSMQRDYIARRVDVLGKQFSAATAVITVTNAVPTDPLYRFARESNIRVVNIDAALPWSLDMPGVALADTPTSDAAWGQDPDPPESATAPYFWLSISNTIRMADIIASDLMALFPDSAAAISRNLDSLKRLMLTLRGDFQNRLMEAISGEVFALTGDFVYLTNDMGLLVDGYFIKQDVRWTEADLEGLTKHLRDGHIEVVLHKWMPSEAIQAAVRAAGARLVVLDAGDPGIVAGSSLAPDGLQQILRKNLEAVYAALQGP